MTNFVITIAGVVLTLSLPVGALVSVTTEGEPVKQVNVVVTLPSDGSPQPSQSPTPSGIPVPTSSPIPSSTPFPSNSPNPSATPNPSAAPTQNPGPTFTASPFSNLPQPSINDFSNVPQPRNMLTATR